MISIQDLPQEIWDMVFENLQLGDLVAARAASIRVWGMVSTRVAVEHLRVLLDRGLPTASCCLEAAHRSQDLVLEKKLQPRRSGRRTVIPLPCHPLQNVTMLRTFNTEADFSQMSLAMKEDIPRLHFNSDFHPCLNGPEPVEITAFRASFRLDKAYTAMSGVVKLCYSTKRAKVQHQIQDREREAVWTTRTISHHLGLDEILWQRSDWDEFTWICLPTHWGQWLGEEVLATMMLEKNLDYAHRVPVLRNPCMPIELKSFSAKWTLSNTTEPRSLFKDFVKNPSMSAEKSA